ncbi:hypothetical protein A3C09_01790 [Candidatus Uhrbacteria bacterium RIFCSPHIGHO2_02_FULL_47_44]|uniref:Lipoprotein n=1 Tax=Candidatus Uhrbacteria bacterium RIFCSPLOWO2_02_FULL_48_18 TaxID=1802408 RepID=A0A1F7V8U7_9BACT|nr:MAG: hypothetical protein A3C09_01790 [Candidatus Uhrbacteria bacterium RIFCSPHIGHO2_02_FULL_47_44]OGL77406.1 MAG: hypothetical protein A3E97_00265 [Candidatus Uhrbacteria bacterium RIFCSPHIGHO2_12_FULL_47_12]OGL81766.1 MAG: hypothetical protein A3B20_01580 [Candidatus Uhrbacteria bacterium RIFCSPLOWO2_01_FULL_47_17]OGL86929.1 MAG: hypothetical protein A3I41_03170 [Candidatus Uhrbacteria bacterium RIFCSPLOWO2_02_FULL_48_18]OGL94328.1 MAG: hypothetical protein A3H12_05020 [Candidatus Uhrbacte
MLRFILLTIGCVTLLGCELKPEQISCVSGSTEVLSGLCDDGNGIAYFSYGNETISSDESLQKLIRYRRAWTDKFPNKEIFAVNMTSYSRARDVCIIWYKFREAR